MYAFQSISVSAGGHVSVGEEADLEDGSGLQGTLRMMTAQKTASTRRRGGMSHSGNRERELVANEKAELMRSMVGGAVGGRWKRWRWRWRSYHI